MWKNIDKIVRTAVYLLLLSVILKAFPEMMWLALVIFVCLIVWKGR